MELNVEREREGDKEQSGMWGCRLFTSDFLEIGNHICTILFTFETRKVHFCVRNVFFRIDQIFKEGLFIPNHSYMIQTGLFTPYKHTKTQTVKFEFLSLLWRKEKFVLHFLTIHSLTRVLIRGTVLVVRNRTSFTSKKTIQIGTLSIWTSLSQTQISEFDLKHS